MYWLALLVAAAPASHLYHVDLSRAVVATPDGAALAEALNDARAKKQGRLRVERERLLTRRGRMRPGAYEAQVDALNQRIEAAEAELTELQDAGLAPILDRMDALLRAQAKAEPTARTVALADVGLLAPNRLCDRTGWLAQAYRGEAKSPPELGACRVGAVAMVRVTEAMQATKRASDRARRLQKLQDKRQAELDRFRQELTKLSAKARATKDARMAAEAARQKEGLDARFARYQAEIADAERAAQTRLRGDIEDLAHRAQRKHRGVVFVEAGPEASTLEPRCDATRWVASVLDGQGDPNALPPACAALLVPPAP